MPTISSSSSSKTRRKRPNLLVDMVQKRVPHKFGLDPLDDIQVLAPMYNGAVGVSNLNVLLQAALNPPGGKKAERRLGGRVFRVGDKVMQTVNNYDKNVYNGDIGRITAMDILQQTITISIDGAPVVYDFLEVDETGARLLPFSVHKSQGAEYPCVVMPVVTSALHDAAAQFAVYGRYSRQKARHPGGHAQSHRHRRQKQQNHPAPHRPGLAAAALKEAQHDPRTH